MNDRDLVLAIQKLLDGVEWTPDTLEQIAALLQVNGYTVNDWPPDETMGVTR